MSGFEDKLNEDKIRSNIAATMPLETPRKPVQEFSGGGSHTPTLDDTKRTSEAPIEFKWDIEELEKMMEEMADAHREPLGTRQPGERGMYEIQRREEAARREAARRPSVG